MYLQNRNDVALKSGEIEISDRSGNTIRANGIHATAIVAAVVVLITSISAYYLSRIE